MDLRTVPVLQISFNRPRLTEVIINELRKLKPNKVYVFIDGPRRDIESDFKNVAICRKMWDSIDWKCEVKTCYQSENLGCRDGVKCAIDWFFSEVEEGIILEDDCVPTESFFKFCAELLERYRDNEEIAMISGNNVIPKQSKPLFQGDVSYSFSQYGLIWGWATWKKSWALYETNASNRQIGDVLKTKLKSRNARDYWNTQISKSYEGTLNTWDTIWTYSLFKHDKLCVIPKENLITNIGFGVEATHTKEQHDIFHRAAYNSGGEMSFPLHHPAVVTEDKELSSLFERLHFRLDSFQPAWKKKLLRFLKRLRHSLWVRLYSAARGRLPPVEENKSHWSRRIEAINFQYKCGCFEFNEEFAINYGDSRRFVPELRLFFLDRIFDTLQVAPKVVDLDCDSGLSILFWKLRRPLSSVYFSNGSREKNPFLDENLRSWAFNGVSSFEEALLGDGSVHLLKFSIHDFETYPFISDQEFLKRVEKLCIAFSDIDFGSNELNQITSLLRQLGYSFDLVDFKKYLSTADGDEKNENRFWLVASKSET